MADRTSASLFARMFEFCAKHPDAHAKSFAAETWEASKDFDFHPSQMRCDKALIALGLAEVVPDPDEPGYSTVVYGPEGDRR